MEGIKRLFIFTSLMVCCTVVHANSDERRLISNLLQNYGKVRPVLNVSDTVNVKFGVALIQILDLHEVEQTITTRLWLRYQWTDQLLRWNMDDFGGINEVRIPIDSIWKPDIRLYNDIADHIIVDTDALAVVSSDGMIIWVPTTIAKSSCTIDLMNFPYDTQSCQLKYGSWTYDGYKMDINFYANMEEIDISNYIQNNEFQLLSHAAIKNVKYYPCCAEPYPDLVFTMELKRQSETITQMIVSPSIVLSLLILAVFWLPANSPVKLALGMFIYLCYLVLQVTMLQPIFTSRSLIGNFIRISMSLDFVAILWSVLAMNLCSFRKVPCCPSKFIKCLSCCLCVRTSSPSLHSSSTDTEMASSGEKAALAQSPSRVDGNEEDGLLVTAVVDRLLFVIYLVIIIVQIATSIPRP